LILAAVLIVCGMLLFALAQFSPILILIITGGLAVASQNAVGSLDQGKAAGKI